MYLVCQTDIVTLCILHRHMEQEIAKSPQLAAAVRGSGGKPVAEMSEEEKGFYYFKLHDIDNNDALDGLELMQAAMHGHEHDEHEHQAEEHGATTERDEQVKSTTTDGGDDRTVRDLQTAEDELEHIICKT